MVCQWWTYSELEPLLIPTDPCRPGSDRCPFHSLARYLTVCRRLPYSVPEPLQAAVQQEFVSWRQESGSQVKAEDLHQLLVLARLLSLSHGRTELTEPVWREARRLEEERRARVERAGPSPAAAPAGGQRVEP